jgi:tetratricopeptide (TPR) repeat protein
MKKIAYSIFIVTVCAACAQAQMAAEYKQIAGQAYQNGNWQAAEIGYTKALSDTSLPPEAPLTYDLYLERGATYLKMTYYKLALADFAQAMRRKPDRSEPLLCHAQAALLLREYNITIKDCTEALRLNNTDDRAYYLRAQAKLENGKTADALDDFSYALRLKPTAAGFSDRGYAKMTVGYWLSAIADFDYAIAIDSTFMAAYRNRATARLQTADLEGAVADYSVILQNAPDPDAYTARALLYHQLGEYKRAIHDFEDALKLNPFLSAAQEGFVKSEQARQLRDTKRM